MGYSSISKYREDYLSKEFGVKSLHEFNESLFKKMGYDSWDEYQDVLKERFI